jgi:putative hydrolase of the HAD superfamily
LGFKLDRANFFEIACEHFTEAGIWSSIRKRWKFWQTLRPRFQLAVLSSFDGRLRLILEQLGISKYFSQVFVSSARRGQTVSAHLSARSAIHWT